MNRPKKSTEQVHQHVYQEVLFQKKENEKLALELSIANKELAFQKEEKGKRVVELGIVNKEFVFQDEEKEKRAAELGIANIELAFQVEEKGKRAAELVIANKELVYQNAEKEKRAAELIIANKELIYQNAEKGKRAAELGIANEELVFQNSEKEKRAAELIIANEELRFQNQEKEKRAAELINANKALEFQNAEKERRAAELEEKNREVEAAKFDIEKKTIQLEASNKYKSEFLANMSHELRTPLNSLLILSKDLSENKKNNLDEDDVESAEIIYKSGNDLLILINEVLDLSKIEAGMMLINIEKVYLKDLADDLIRGFKPLAEQKGLMLNAHLDNRLPEYIDSDSQRLNQILKNLIANAIKFTDKGSVTINLHQHSENSIIVSVSDTGIGIPENKQVAIFEAFQQVDGTTSRKYGGTGLGLSISSKLAKLLGAKITLNSRVGKGSTFLVDLPLTFQSVADIDAGTNIIRQANPIGKISPENHFPLARRHFPLKRMKINTERPNDFGIGKTKILLVDDDYRNLFAMSKILTGHGMEVVKAGNGIEALEKLRAHPGIDLVLMDIMMPEMDGYEAMRQIRAQSKYAGLPVIAVTAKAMNYDEQKCLEAGANGYIAKPVDIESLLLMTVELLRGKK